MNSTRLCFLFLVALVLRASHAHAQPTATALPPGTQVIQMPDGTYVIIVPDTTVPPAYAPAPTAPQAPPPAYVPDPRATAGAAYAPAYPAYAGYPGYAADARGQYARADRLAAIGRRLPRERNSLIAGTVGMGAFVAGLALALGTSSSCYDHYGAGTCTGHGRAGGGIGLALLGGGTAFGGLWTSAIVGMRTSRDFVALSAPSVRGVAISNLVAMSIFEPFLSVPLGWAHYGVSRRRFAALTGGRYQAGLTLSVRPMFDPMTGVRGAAIGGSF